MTVKFKPGLHVVTADGSELVLIDRAPVNIWRWVDGGEIVPPCYRPESDGTVQVANFPGMTGQRLIRWASKHPTHDGRGRGAPWWAQDATTGRPLSHSVRESELTLLADGAVMSA